MTILGNRQLPLLPPDAVGAHTRASRDPMTCLFKCGNACDQPEPNRSGNPHLQDEIARVLGRRRVLQGALLGGATLVLAGAATEDAAAAPTADRVRRGSLARTWFRPVRPNRRDAVVTASGFTSSVVIRWGDRVLPGAPAFDARRQTVAAARRQFGFNCDYVGLVPLRERTDEALLVVNHEYTNDELMFPPGIYTDDEKRALSMYNHGMSVVRVRQGLVPGSWKQVTPLRRAPENRRINVETEFRLTGPVAGDPRVRTSADPRGRTILGTLNNCSGGTTPWGTVLSGEENINQYFDAGDGVPEEYAEEYARYGITGEGKGWSSVDPRFDLSREPHEPHRFGWVVEVDPSNPSSVPRKHSMLGRFKHEGANIIIARNGRAVAYLGDDERGEYLYKFVSRDRVDRRPTRAARRHNLGLLGSGTLHVARLRGDGLDDDRYDGTGRWIPLTSDRRSFVAGMSVADVLLFTRLAADRVGATRMDRPEDVEPNPVNGRIYAALTNNSERGTTFPVDEANPRGTSMVRAEPGAPLTPAAGNRHGYVLELVEDRGRHTGLAFGWNLMLVCGDPASAETWFGGFDKRLVSPISCPDNVAFDSSGNLWVSTDGNALGSNDGIFRVPTSGLERGRVAQFLTVPPGAEACGPLVADGDRSLFFAVQHPGEVTGATFEEPASTWPHTDDFPRPSVCVAHRDR
ncbi:PhoX family phosphatase [Nocardioides dongxiaopingii]|uniref:PhoX family protein n=1 Tax=Nocardioides sp. S-1144 TaxID=2582905 RepID=UPI00110DACC3|nr:PhoX family phosphatase [Nocardioides sp. S-1144]QCW50581.1 PhoX family phosphatase [Nocardioides sp. S-1144]